MMAPVVPQNLVYFYKDPRWIFRTISDCPEAEADTVLDGKNVANTFFADRFDRENRRRELEHRAIIEELLLADFIAKGGKPKRQFPYYAYLAYQTYREMRPSLAGTAFANCLTIEMSLSEFPSDIISFTYEDSGLSYGLVFHPQGLREWARSIPAKGCHGVLYRVEELEALIAEYGFPANCLEAQIWDDAPLEKYRNQNQPERLYPDSADV